MNDRTENLSMTRISATKGQRRSWKTRAFVFSMKAFYR